MSNKCKKCGKEILVPVILWGNISPCCSECTKELLMELLSIKGDVVE